MKPDQVRAWLRDTDDGKRIAQEMWMSAVAGSGKVVVVLWPEGFVELYADPSVSLRVIQLPLECGDPSMEGQDGATLTEELVAARCGVSHAHVYEPKNLRWCGWISKESAMKQAHFLVMRKMLQELKGAQDARREKRGTSSVV